MIFRWDKKSKLFRSKVLFPPWCLLIGTGNLKFSEDYNSEAPSYNHLALTNNHRPLLLQDQLQTIVKPLFHFVLCGRFIIFFIPIPVSKCQEWNISFPFPIPGMYYQCWEKEREWSTKVGKKDFKRALFWYNLSPIFPIHSCFCFSHYSGKYRIQIYEVKLHFTFPMIWSMSYKDCTYWGHC